MDLCTCVLEVMSSMEELRAQRGESSQCCRQGSLDIDVTLIALDVLWDFEPEACAYTRRPIIDPV